jgi:hypothetical protein
MGFFQRMLGLGRAAPPAPDSSRLHSQMSSMAASQQVVASQNTTRRELLRVVLRDTLTRHGIPSTWIAAELLNSTSRKGERGVHWRLHIKHWDPRLATHAVALQNALIKRLMTFDPLASSWLSGISWQFSLDDETQCPALPNPTSWTAPPRARRIERRSADSASTPLHIGGAPLDGRDAQADLGDLLAARDADFRQHAAAPGSPRTWASTEPAKL